MNLENLPFNVFDLVLVAVLVTGIIRGRKHGMSEELLGLIKWLVILFGCAAFYEPGGSLLAQFSGFSLLSCYLMTYVAGALIILASFAGLKHGLGGKLLGSDLFGGAEYYLGMVSGFVRFSCMLLVALALLNARLFTEAELQAKERFNKDVY